MDPALLAAIGGGLTGLGGIAAVLKVVADARTSKRTNEAEQKKASSTAAATAADLANTLNSTAQDWIQYIDGKFGEVSEELADFKAATKAKDAARALLHQAHRAWDFDLKGKLESVTGERMADPPPLDIE